MKNGGIRRHVALLSCLVASLLVYGCEESIPLPGTNTQFVTSGSADDADPTDGPGQTYNNPARQAADGPSRAVSDPRTHVELGGEIEAVTTQQSHGLATALAHSKAESGFTMAAGGKVHFKVLTTATASLSSGKGHVRFVAKILNPNGTFVQNSQFEIAYDFDVNTQNTGQVDIKKNGVLDTTINQGAPYQDEVTGPTFQLAAGNYLLSFEITDSGEAERFSKVKAISKVVGLVKE